MQIISQSSQFLDDTFDLIQQIGHRARICYQSFDAENEETNVKLVKNCIKIPHASVLEMGRITIECVRSWNSPHKMNHFIEKSSVINGKIYYSSSVRGWRENWYKIPKMFGELLTKEYPDLFGDLFESVSCTGPEGMHFISIKDYPVDGPEYKYHKYQAVKFITNRAMTHEIVRHRPCSYLQESQRYVRYDKPGGIEFIKPLWYSDSHAISSPENDWTAAMNESEFLYLSLLSKGLKPQQAREVLPNSTKTEIIVYASLAEWVHIEFMRSQGGADPMMKALMAPVLSEFRTRFPEIFTELKPSKAGR